MKKIFTLLAAALIAAPVFAQDAADGSLWLNYSDGTQNAKTMTDIYSSEEVQNADGLTWENGVQMYLVKTDKEYSGGMTNATYNKPIKLSNGAPNALILPEGFSTNKIEFYGYCNDKDVNNVAWIATILDATGVELYKAEIPEGASAPADNFVQNVAKFAGYDQFEPETSKPADEFFGKLELDQIQKITCNLSQAVSGTIWFKNGGKQPCFYIKIYKADDSALGNIAVDENAPVVYYNLQGAKVANPSNGLYIRVQGNKAEKVVL